MRRTKVLKAFQERYEEARAVRPEAEALGFALARMEEDTGIEVRIEQAPGGGIHAVSVQPSGLCENSEVQSQDTPTLRVRAVEDVLSKTYAKNRWR